MTEIQICEDDLTEEKVKDLLALHLSGMQSNSPAESVFALDISGLKHPDVTVWTVRVGKEVAAIGALKQLDGTNGELKSMRTHPDFVRMGFAKRLLDHIVLIAKRRGYRRLSLETGSGAEFEAALQLYRNNGFVAGPAFGEYAKSEFNQFFHLALDM